MESNRSKSAEAFLKARGYRWSPPGPHEEARLIVAIYYKRLDGVPTRDTRTPMLAIHEFHVESAGREAYHSFEVALQTESPQSAAIIFKYYALSEDGLAALLTEIEDALARAWRALFTTPPQAAPEVAEMMRSHEYIGDGVYLYRDPGRDEAVLRTSDGVEVTNTIYLDGQSLEALRRKLFARDDEAG